MFFTELHVVIRNQFIMAQYGIKVSESNRMAVFETDAYLRLIEEMQNKEEPQTNTTLSK